MQTNVRSDVSGPVNRGTSRRKVATMLLGGVAALTAGAAAARPALLRDAQQPQPAPGGVEIIREVTPDMLIPLLREAKFGEPQIKEWSKKGGYLLTSLHGMPVALFVGADEGRSLYMLFEAELGEQKHIDHNQMNAWNRSDALSRLVRQGNGRLAFQMGTGLGGGVTLEFVKWHIGLCVSKFERMLKFTSR